MNCKSDYAIKDRLPKTHFNIWMTFDERHILYVWMRFVYRIPCLLCCEMISRISSRGTNVQIYLSDKLWLRPLSFSLCCCCYHNHSAMSSFKCEGLMFFSIHLLEALQSFSSHIFSSLSFYSVSENACGLKLFKCSLLRTSCLITYLLDLLSHIFSLKDKLKEKCRLSSSQRELRDLKEFKKTLVLINNSHLIACILVK